MDGRHVFETFFKDKVVKDGGSLAKLEQDLFVLCLGIGDHIENHVTTTPLAGLLFTRKSSLVRCNAQHKNLEMATVLVHGHNNVNSHFAITEFKYMMRYFLSYERLT